MAVEADIHDSFGHLHKALDSREAELVGQLHQLTQAKLKGLTIQRNQVEIIQAQLSSCLLFMKESLKIDNKEKVLPMKTTTVRQVKELTTTFQSKVLEPSVEADLTFS